MSLSYLDSIRQKIAYRVADFLAGTNITPNQITIFRFVVSVPVCAYFFSRGTYFYNLIGLALYLALAILDWADGRLARITGKSSLLGKWADITTDRILVLIVLGSFFYAGISSNQYRMWINLGVLFYSSFFFMAVTNDHFDRMFNTDFDAYPEIEDKMLKAGKRVGPIDKFLVNFLFVHRNSISKFCFCVSYPLFLGIIINQLFPAFVFITFMLGVRIIGFLFIMYRAVRKGETNSAMTLVLREYMKKNG